MPPFAADSFTFTVASSAWRDFGRIWRMVFAFEVAFGLAEAWLLVPAVGSVLARIMEASGHVAVSNRDVLAFVLSPLGLAYAATFAAAAAGFLLLEQAGIMAIAATGGGGVPPSPRAAMRLALWSAMRVPMLGAIKLGVLAAASSPFLLLAGLVYGLLLPRHDINFYLDARPIAFWAAQGIGTLLATGALGVGAWLLVRWSFALPILLFEGRPAAESLRESGARTRGKMLRLAVILIGWPASVLLLGAGIEMAFSRAAAAILRASGGRPIVPILGLLFAQGGLLVVLSAARGVGQALLTRRLYLLRNVQLGLPAASRFVEADATARPPTPWARPLALLAIAAVLIGPLAVWSDLPRRLAARPPVRITAHRGHSGAAPENTLSAIRKAAESGAEYAEIDVQRTADGVAVLLHDRDLMRVAGDPRRVGRITLDELKALDVGRSFDARFAGERAPTLAEAIRLARGRLRLNVELKYDGPDPGLAPEVERVIREEGFAPDCLVTSFDADALRELKRLDPDLRTGLIVAFALGDVGRLDHEVLSVRADWLSDGLLRAAHREGKEVHVWTVNDERAMARLIERGVDNVITDHPDVMARVRAEWSQLTAPERLVLASRLLLGVGP